MAVRRWKGFRERGEMGRGEEWGGEREWGEWGWRMGLEGGEGSEDAWMDGVGEGG